MKRINIDIDKDLMDVAMKKSGSATKKELVTKALVFYRNLLTKKRNIKVV